MPGSQGPVIVMAHGFAGSRTMLKPIAFYLARRGYRVTTFDFPGHGENPNPMSSEFKLLSGATQQLEDSLRSVVNAKTVNEPQGQQLGLIGHSMATDIMVRLAKSNPRIGPTVGISLYSDEITATEPPNMLMISGEYEPGLRAVALKMVRLVDAAAKEGEIVEGTSGVRRAALVSPGVEHVGVLYSSTTKQLAADWMDQGFGLANADAPSPRPIGISLLITLAGAILCFLPISKLLGGFVNGQQAPPKKLWICIVIPSILAPIIAGLVHSGLGDGPVPMPGMTYLTIHLCVFGLATLFLLRRVGLKIEFNKDWWPAIFYGAYCLGVIAVLIDLLFSSFVPSANRIFPMLALMIGCIPFMIGESVLLYQTNVPWWYRFVLRLAVFGSLAAGIALAPESRAILGFFFPVFILFYLVFGTIARWILNRTDNILSVGTLQGIVLAYAFACSVPIVSA